MVNFDVAALDAWGPAVWDVIFDRLQSGSIKGGVITWPSITENKTKTAAQQIQWATKLPLAQLPQNILEIIYGRFVGFPSAVRYIDPSKIHALHGLLQGVLGSSVETWLKRPQTVDKMRARIRSYRDYDEAMAHLSQHTASAEPETDSDPKTDPAYDAAKECAECLEFLINWDIVKCNGYDQSGRNWIEAALDGLNMRLLTYLVNKVDPKHLLARRDLREPHEDHILLALAGIGAFPQFETALTRLSDAGLASLQELREIFHNAAMHELCAIAPVSIASALHKHGINIANVKHQYHELGGQLESSWHIAAAFNPAGSDFMEFLLEYSVLSPDIRNSENMNPLMYAACFDEPASIAWLCTHIDPTLPRLPDGPRGYALICAARSSHMCSGVIFAIILSHLPSELFTLEYGKIIGCEIAEGLVSHKRRLKDGRSVEPTQGVMEVLAVRKMQAFVRRLPADWAGSDWYLALEAFVRDHDVPILKHSMGTVTRKLRSGMLCEGVEEYPDSPSLGQKLQKMNDDNVPIDMADIDPLLGVVRRDSGEMKAFRVEMRMKRPGYLAARSKGRPSTIGRMRDSNYMVTKRVRRHWGWGWK
ncbi:hypothetical protein N7535_006103 [Penicillium sp. DV-2018c]|nr:hypothetical protein N7461_007815 [Penicillium sp. DV-2018c]KAJ5566797.1 hypothetical protein N7535_006103 [Penicillium sp. DV-2018c]